MLHTNCPYTNYVLDKQMNFNTYENNEAKMKELKHILEEQLKEQMGVARKIFIPLLNSKTLHIGCVRHREKAFQILEL